MAKYIASRVLVFLCPLQIQDVGYWVVLGMALCVQNANADVKVVDVQFHCLSGNCVNWGSKYGFMGAVCPGGYVMTGCNILRSYDCSSGDNGATCFDYPPPIFNSNTNPTQCGYGTLSPSWNAHPSITGKAICAKVCN